jgi:hypothetical protein
MMAAATVAPVGVAGGVSVAAGCVQAGRSSLRSGVVEAAAVAVGSGCCGLR